MPVPAAIVKLVELFQRNADQYAAPAFSEAAAHHQFIDPFFAALGWDGPTRRLPSWKGLVSNCSADIRAFHFTRQVCPPDHTHTAALMSPSRLEGRARVQKNRK